MYFKYNRPQKHRQNACKLKLAEYLLQTFEIERRSNVFYFESTWIIKTNCRSTFVIKYWVHWIEQWLSTHVLCYDNTTMKTEFNIWTHMQTHFKHTCTHGQNELSHEIRLNDMV